jgi:prevent-host-death family protein
LRARNEVDIDEAKAHLSSLLSRVAAGESIVIARAGRPIARLVPIEDRSALRPVGMERGRLRVSDDFDASLDDETLESFER